MRLLLVEDDERMVALLQRALAENGYAVDVAGDAVIQLTRTGHEPLGLDGDDQSAT